MRLDSANFNEAVRQFEAAIATAKQQQARMFWLRAAKSLSRAWAANGSRERGLGPLQEVVDAFSGDDQPRELAMARYLLSRLCRS